MLIIFNLISAVDVDAGAQDVEMPRHEGVAGLIDKVIRPKRLSTLALKRLCYPRRIRLRNLGLYTHIGKVCFSLYIEAFLTAMSL